MRLFECEVDGARYWVAAETLKDAMDRAFADCLLAGGDISTDLSMCSAEESNEERAKKQRFHDDETGTVRPMWEEFQMATEPRVLACSEW